MWYYVSMAKHDKRKGHGCLITLLVVVILGLLVWFVGIPLANDKVGNMVDSTIQEAFESPDMPQLGYSGLQINAQKGEVAVSDISLPMEDGSSVKAKKIVLKVDPAELVAFGLGQSEGLSRANVELEEFTYGSKEIGIGFSRAKIALDGKIDLNYPERTVIRDVKLDAKSVKLTDPVSSLEFTSETLALDLTGNITAATLEKDVEGILDDIAYVDLAASNGKLVPNAEVLSQLETFATVSPWISDTGNWGFETVGLEARTLSDSVAIDAFSLAAPLMDAKGKATLPRGESGPLALDMDVADMNAQVRQELAPIAGIMGYSIPEESFNLSVDWDGGGLPSITLR